MLAHCTNPLNISPQNNKEQFMTEQKQKKNKNGWCQDVATTGRSRQSKASSRDK